MGMLNPELYRSKIRELESYLKDNVPEEILKARDAALEEAKNQNDDDESGDAVDGENAGNGDDNGNTEREVQEIEAAALAAAIADAQAKHESNEDLSEAEGEFLAKVRGLKFASSALSFIEVFENANDSFQSMLMSSNPSDVTEALRFFVKAKHFGLPCAVTGMKRALALMWSNETNIQVSSIYIHSAIQNVLSNILSCSLLRRRCCVRSWRCSWPSRGPKGRNCFPRIRLRKISWTWRARRP